MWWTATVTERRITRPRRMAATTVGRMSRDIRVRLGADLRHLRKDAGISQRRVSTAAAIDHGHLSLVERGEREVSLSALAALAHVLGADVSVRLYSVTGPRIRDPIQSRILEALLAMIHPRWDRLLEVPVSRPARGVIDAVFLGSPPPVAVCTEIQSELRRLEQLIRWANEKASSLPSAPFWDRIEATPRIDRLLIVRSTRSSREIVARFEETLRVAYPGRCADAHAALTGTASPWPASTILWATVDGDRAEILDRPPRTIALGR
jgi:transcriptional regulator with XRE-family HTH domain